MSGRAAEVVLPPPRRARPGNPPLASVAKVEREVGNFAAHRLRQSRCGVGPVSAGFGHGPEQPRVAGRQGLGFTRVGEGPQFCAQHPLHDLVAGRKSQPAEELLKPFGRLAHKVTVAYGQGVASMNTGRYPVGRGAGALAAPASEPLAGSSVSIIISVLDDLQRPLTFYRHPRRWRLS